jgi:hypothetical protein
MLTQNVYSFQEASSAFRYDEKIIEVEDRAYYRIVVA